MKRTTIINKEQVERKWLIVDARGKRLGRLASNIASILRGKNKPAFVPFMDLGDFVVVVNADKIVFTGNKIMDKKYWRHMGYPGGLKIFNLKEIMEKDPPFVLKNAVKGMLPHNRLGKRLLKKLKIYAGPDHPHQAQKPEKIDI